MEPLSSKLSLPIAVQKEIRSLQDRIPDISDNLNSLEISATGNNPSLSFFDLKSKESIRFAESYLLCK